MEQTAATWQVDFGAWLERKGVNAKTIKAYGIALANFADWYREANEEEFNPERLSGFDLVRYRQWTLEIAGKKPATWNQRLAALRKLAKWVSKTAALPQDLFEDVKKAQSAQHAPDWLTDAEFGRLGSYLHSTAFDARDNTALRQARVTRNRALVTLLVYAGLREFEAAALLVEDVQLSARKGLVVVRMGKGGKRREIPLGDARARAVVQRWFEVRGGGRGFLFTDDEGGKLSERSIQVICADIGGRCKIEDLRPHRCRHTFGKRLIDAGVDVFTVARLMGHSNVNTTLDYAEPGHEDLERATALIGQGRMAHKGANNG